MNVIYFYIYMSMIIDMNVDLNSIVVFVCGFVFFFRFIVYIRGFLFMWVLFFLEVENVLF